MKTKDLLALSKVAKRDKNYDLEKDYLHQALNNNPENLKILNAMARNARKRGDKEEYEIWLKKILVIKPSGIVLDELIKLARGRNDIEREKELLRMRLAIEPKNARAGRRLSMLGGNRDLIEKITQTVSVSEIVPLSISVQLPQIIPELRRMIYGEDSLEEKENMIRIVLADVDEGILVAVLAELYKSQSYMEWAQGLVKKYKSGIDPETEKAKLKMANKLYQLVVNKRMLRGDWDFFWRNSGILSTEDKGRVKAKKIDYKK